MEKWMPATRRTVTICLTVLVVFLYCKGINDAGFLVLGSLLTMIDSKGA